MKMPYIATYINNDPEALLGEAKVTVELANKFLAVGNKYNITAVDIHSYHTLVKVEGSGVWLSNLRFKKNNNI